MPQKPRHSELVPLLTLLAIAAVLLAGWLLFPRLLAWMQFNDCMAAGYTYSSCAPGGG